MKKEVKPKVIQPSEIILHDKIKQREKIRQEFLQQQKEKYKKKENKHDLKEYKKQIISQLKDIVKHRALDESKNIVILEENVLSFFSRNYRDLGYEIKEDEYWFNLLPLSYEELINRTLKLIRDYKIRISGIIRDEFIPTKYLNFYYNNSF